MVIGVDFGTKYIGIAQSDETETIAQPLMHVYTNQRKKMPKLFLNRLKGMDITHIVYGLPVSMKGEATRISKLMEEFAETVYSKNAVEYSFWDESMTSVQASMKTGQNSSKIHSEAARIILQEYLDHQKKLNQE